MYTSEELLEKVNVALQSISYDRKPFRLYAPIQYELSLGGKRVRPVLTLLSYNMYKEQPEEIMPVALGLEIYHNYTLLHDDVMDRAEVRRGKPCVHKVWDDNSAILSGDSMLVLAYRYVASCADDKLRAVMSLFTETALEIGEGQQFDLNFEERNDVSEAEYIEMIRLKTSVLLACALKMGALLAGAPEEDADCLYRFGEKIGLSFQLQDDYLDVYGDEKTFGKRIGGDILCNKKTYMLIRALEFADAASHEELMRWINARTYDEQEKIAAVTALYTKIGVDKMALEKISAYYKEAEEELAKVRLPEAQKSVLWSYARSLLGRKS